MSRHQIADVLPAPRDRDDHQRVAIESRARHASASSQPASQSLSPPLTYGNAPPVVRAGNPVRAALPAAGHVFFFFACDGDAVLRHIASKSVVVALPPRCNKRPRSSPANDSSRRSGLSSRERRSQLAAGNDNSIWTPSARKDERALSLAACRVTSRRWELGVNPRLERIMYCTMTWGMGEPEKHRAKRGRDCVPLCHVKELETSCCTLWRGV